VAVGPLCRAVEVPGVYFVAVARSASTRVLGFQDNWFTGVIDSADDEELDLSLIEVDGSDQRRYELGPRHQGRLPPPWNAPDVERYADVPRLPIPPLSSAALVTNSPIGNVEVFTRYERGVPVERRLESGPSVDAAAVSFPGAEVRIKRRFSSILLRTAGVIDVLASYEGGSVEGDWSKLMLLAGITDGPEITAANRAGTLTKSELVALALFSELWARGAVSP
jgi:hypothetical protein